MISVDTNVLARFFLRNDPEQYRASSELIETALEGDGIYISPFALLELAWVLKTSGLQKIQICEIIRQLLYMPNVSVGMHDTVKHAINMCIKGKSDIADYLILADSRQQHASGLASFDRILCKEHKDCRDPGRIA